jgi:hypothetical protein
MTVGRTSRLTVRGEFDFGIVQLSGGLPEGASPHLWRRWRRSDAPWLTLRERHAMGGIGRLGCSCGAQRSFRRGSRNIGAVPQGRGVRAPGAGTRRSDSLLHLVSEMWWSRSSVSEAA